MARPGQGSRYGGDVWPIHPGSRIASGYLIGSFMPIFSLIFSYLN